MSGLRRLAHRAARGAARSLPPRTREVALSLAARAGSGPAIMPGPPPGPVLVVAPHPDDETIGCGGALARHAQQGDQVTVLVATSGEATAAGGPEIAARREAECRAACLALGVPAPVFLRLPDGGLGAHVDALAEALRHHGADARSVYVPTLLDPHADHQAANRALAQAALPGDTFGYEVWAAAPVDAVLDISGAWQRKQAALEGYVTALQTVDYLRACQGLAAYRGISAGLGAASLAEGFLRLSAQEHRSLLLP